MRTESELNEALAEWRGWKPIHNNKGAILQWIRPDGVKTCIEPPDFCNSLDACICWLGPKLNEWHLWYDGKTGNFIFKIHGEGIIAPSASLAFARAEEQVMDAEKGAK